ncbi:MAG TPA: hypothetical protein VHA54_12160 [Solirubrobacterales bacterium]|nr:hypothetical protein [Solirubrobacterales bacterium]
MSLGRPTAPGRKLSLAAAIAVLALLVSALVASSAPAVTPASCPSFKVLHNDRIGPASLPAGEYAISLDSPSLTCASASKLFARFLEDYDGVLPKPWRVVAEGSGKASFEGGAQGSFAVARSGGGESGGTDPLGRLCPNTFTVNAKAMVGPLLFPRGGYLLYLPPGSGITCNRASVLFTRFLAQPGGILPFPWRLKNQTATFFKAQNPVRSAFRVEPIAGAGPA